MLMRILQKRQNAAHRREGHFVFSCYRNTMAKAAVD